MKERKYETNREIRVEDSASLVVGSAEVDRDVNPSEFDIMKAQKDKIVSTNDNAEHRAIFESGAAWQREHHYTPHIQNSVEAHKEALARWPD